MLLRRRGYQSVAIFVFPALPRQDVAPSKIPKCHVFPHLPHGALCPRGCRVSSYRVLSPCPGSICPSGALRPRSPLPRWGLAPSKLPKCRYLSCFSPAQVPGRALVKKMSPFTVFPPCPSDALRFGTTRALLLIVAPPLPKWGSPPSKLPQSR